MVEDAKARIYFNESEHFAVYFMSVHFEGLLLDKVTQNDNSERNTSKCFVNSRSTLINEDLLTN